MPAVTIYTTPYCPFCRRAKMLLRSKQVAFEDIDVGDYDERRALEERTGWPTVPQVFIGEAFIGGNDELQALEDQGELDALLAGADEKTPGEAFEELVALMARLRAPGGCPWDREQTHDSIKPYLIEEAYEVVEAIDAGDADELRKELGDLLLQVVFHAQMAQEAGRFDAADVARAICDKLLHRHPHVFGDVEVKDAAEVLQNWSRIKAEERSTSDDRSAIAGVPRAMPALLRAARLGDKAAGVGFDWKSAIEVLDKVREEVRELDEALRAGRQDEIDAELGDVLFALTSVARHAGVEPESALARAADRFSRRFRAMEAELQGQGRDLHDVPVEEMEAVWQRVKRQV